MAARAEDLEQRLTQAIGRRSEHESTWRQCAEYTFPLRASGWQSNALNAVTGQEAQAELLDDVSTQSANTLAASIVSGSVPANSRWFDMDVYGVETDSAKRWLEDAADTVWTNIHAANFDSTVFECALDYVTVGMFAMFVDEDEGGGFRFEQWPLHECYFACARRGGVIDTVYRKFKLTAQQAVAQFGEDKVTREVRELADTKPYELVEFGWALYPRGTMGVMSSSMPVASCIWERKGKHLVREGGYHEMPLIVPRWKLLPDGVYAVGPTYDALPNIKTLNELKALQMAALDVAVSGMWIAKDDGVLNARTLKIGPRKVIVANDTDSLKPLGTGADFNVAFVSEERLQAAIRRAYMADQLQPQDGPAMTATEVHARIGLIRQLLGPIFGRMQSEFLQPLVERCFGLAYRAGALGQAPRELQGQNFAVRYISPLARAQKLEEVSAIERFAQTAMTIAQAKPEVMDLFDAEAGMRAVGDALGVPNSAIRSADDVDALRKIRAEQQAAAQQQAQQQAVAQQLTTSMIDAGAQRLAQA